MTTPREHDYYHAFKKPAAWKKAKACFPRQFFIAQLMELLEEAAGTGTPRILLAIAMHAYLSAPAEQRTQMLYDYHDWCARADGDAVPPCQPMDEAERLPACDRVSEYDFSRVVWSIKGGAK